MERRGVLGSLKEYFKKEPDYKDKVLEALDALNATEQEVTLSEMNRKIFELYPIKFFKFNFPGFSNAYREIKKLEQQGLVKSEVAKVMDEVGYEQTVIYYQKVKKSEN